jgi:DNA processing protein
VSAPHPVVELAAGVVATGGDPERLVRLLGWLVTPGRGGAGLRARVTEAGAGRQLRLDPGGGVGTLGPVLPVTLDRTRTEPVTRVLRGWQRLGVRVATVDDPGYPGRLRKGWPHLDVPPLLAWRGVPLDDGHPTVAIVGARRATGYGTGVAAWLAEAASAAGARVLSGGALGIDAAAHHAALERPGGTSVVLGCGHDVRYPRPHAEPGGLFDRVVDHGGTLLSEHLPGARPHAGNVRARNRIVAGLADVVVVVEGGPRSGALVTATEAAERGVPVLAVPGDVRAPGSVAPHRLLAEGAGPCTAPADLLEALGTHVPPGAATDTVTAGSAARSAASVLPGDVRALLVEAWPRPVAIDELAARCGRPAAVLLGALTRARVAGETAEDTGGVRLRRAPR